MGSRPSFDPRCDLAVPLEVRVERHGADPIEAHATNLSTSGLCLHLREALPLGSAVLLRVALPSDAERITARGRVTWCEEPAATLAARFREAGIRFEVVSEADRARLDRFVRDCDRDLSGAS